MSTRFVSASVAIVLSAIASVAFPCPARASLDEVNLGGIANWDITQAPPGGLWAFDTWPGAGQSYSGNSGTGIPFDLLSPGQDNVWLGQNTESVTINLNIADPTTAYTLFNEQQGGFFFGPVVSIEFVGSGGAAVTYVLDSNAGINDWYNVAPTGGAQRWWVGAPPSGAVQSAQSGNSHLDMQTFDLGGLQSQNLDEIIIAAQSGVGLGTFEPFLSGITVETGQVPEPESLAVFGTALIGFGVLTARRKKTPAAA